MQPGAARAWLRTVAALHIFGGLSLPILLRTPLFDLYQISNSILLESFPFARAAPGRSAFEVGLFGPTIASWGLLFLFVVGAAFERRDRAAWWTLVVSVAAWGPYDALLSFGQGLYVNVLADVLVMAGILLPLLLTRPHFFHAGAAR